MKFEIRAVLVVAFAHRISPPGVAFPRRNASNPRANGDCKYRVSGPARKGPLPSPRPGRRGTPRRGFSRPPYDLEIGDQVLALGLGSQRHGDDDQHQEHGRAHHHRQREAHLHLDGEVAQHRRHEAGPDRALVIDEARGRRAHLGREALAQVARVLAVDRAAEHALQNEAQDDQRRVVGPQIERRHEDGEDAGHDDRGPPAPFVGHAAPHGAAGEDHDVGPEQRRRHHGRRPRELLLQIGREQPPDRVVDAECRRHPGAGRERVEEVLPPEDDEQRRLHFRLPLDLLPLVLGPHFGLLHIEADPHHRRAPAGCRSTEGRANRYRRRGSRRPPTRARSPGPTSPAGCRS